MTTTFQAVDPTTGESFGASFNESTAQDVVNAITKAAKTKSAFAATSPAKRAAI